MLAGVRRVAHYIFSDSTAPSPPVTSSPPATWSSDVSSERLDFPALSPFDCVERELLARRDDILREFSELQALLPCLEESLAVVK